MISLRFQSQLSAPPQQVWAQVSTMAGVNAELPPLMRMTPPADLRLPAAGGCVVTDELEIQPRLGLFAPMLRLIVTALFQHRHRYLRRQFGALQG